MLPTPSLLPRPSLNHGQQYWLDRWDRIGLGVRLAYNPAVPQAIRAFLHAGRCLTASGAREDLEVQIRTLTVLIDTALDPMLPRAWRAACLEHVCLPLARLTTHARRTGRVHLSTWQRRIEEAERNVSESAGCGDVNRW